MFTGQDKKAPLHIRRAYYDAHQEMDHTTTKLQGAAEDLKKCYENVLHEDALHQRVPSMTSAHYDSLRQVFVGRGGHKESAMLYWLQLSLNAADPGQGGNDILSYFRVTFEFACVNRTLFVTVIVATFRKCSLLLRKRR